MLFVVDEKTTDVGLCDEGGCLSLAMEIEEKLSKINEGTVLVISGCTVVEGEIWVIIASEGAKALKVDSSKLDMTVDDGSEMVG